MNLSGIWEFAFTSTPEEKVQWSTVAPVPGCFDAAGLRFLQRGCGWYRREVRAGGRLRLHIASFGLRLSAFWDGKLLGTSAFAWSPAIFEFDSEEGLHTLTLRADNLLEGHPLFREIYDFYGFGGIYDHVTLENIPQDEVRSLAVLPLDHRTGEVELRIETTAPQLRIAFDDGEPQVFKNTPAVRLRVPDFRLWSPEHPNLHKVTVNEKTVEFGLRTLDWHGKSLLLNGNPVKLIGLNRHESHPEFGAATPEFLIASDLMRIKEAGCNFIRGSHYPQREILFRLCDRLGIMVWEEPLSWGNCAKDLADPVFMDSLSEQFTLTLKQSFNHPSLIIHGFLNECASDTPEGYAAVKRMMELSHRLDPTRPATFASNRPARDISFDLVDLISLNIYPAWYDGKGLDSVVQTLKEFAEKFPEKPLLISEIGAGAFSGDHTGAPWSEEYQAELIRLVLKEISSNPRYSGVAIWLFANSNTYTSGIFFKIRPRGFNNKGLLDEYRRPKMAWNILKQFNHEEEK